ncbi:hypothetical protein KEM48_011077 [Puccinia striiformis f. sp. tritici PST-130]|nr:hypothetical protein KEM48_011077 [Puccinia striiformis f. sp. tritici PST-130]
MQQADSGVVILNGPGSSVPIALQTDTEINLRRILGQSQKIESNGHPLIALCGLFHCSMEVLQTEIHQSKLYQILYCFNLVPARAGHLLPGVSVLHGNVDLSFIPGTPLTGSRK